MQRRGLLPRVFTLTGEKKEKLRRFFSVTLFEDCSPLRFPQTGALPCADFPQDPQVPRQKRSAILAAKIEEKKKLCKDTADGSLHLIVLIPP